MKDKKTRHFKANFSPFKNGKFQPEKAPRNFNFLTGFAERETFDPLRSRIEPVRVNRSIIHGFREVYYD
jgi:hypothetical protein